MRRHLFYPQVVDSKEASAAIVLALKDVGFLNRGRGRTLRTPEARDNVFDLLRDRGHVFSAAQEEAIRRVCDWFVEQQDVVNAAQALKEQAIHIKRNAVPAPLRMWQVVQKRTMPPAYAAAMSALAEQNPGFRMLHELRAELQPLLTLRPSER